MSPKVLTLIVLALLIGFGAILISPLSGETRKLNERSINISPKATPDYSRYPAVFYNADLSREPERQEKNSRYDLKYVWVKSRPHPSDGGVNLVTEEPAPAAVPKDADLVVLGRVIQSAAFLTEGKKNIYSEFVFQVADLLKQHKGVLVRSGDLLTIDRRGGKVRYENGQELVYSISGYEMPQVGVTYLVFLKTDTKSPNYKLITGYEILTNTVLPLDPVVPADFTGRKTREEIINFVKDEIGRP